VLLAEVSHQRPDLRCFGVDISFDRLAHARSHAQVEVAAGRAEALPFPEGCFDLVYCRLLMEYLPAPEQAMAELIRVCRPGGSILVQDSTASWLTTTRQTRRWTTT
jgi:ubiquinone/menaquinone biosynthesis C-methylase UbiE